MSTPDELEQQTSLTGDLPSGPAPDLPLEAAEADALEQATDDAPAEHRTDRELPVEAPEADAVEQAQVVHLDEDEGRDA